MGEESDRLTEDRSTDDRPVIIAAPVTNSGIPSMVVTPAATMAADDDDPDTIPADELDTRTDPGFAPVASEPESPEAVRAQIAQTRAEMSETIEALKEKLNPEALKEQAKEAVKEAASNAVHSTVEKAKEAVGGAVEATKEAVGNAISATKEAMGGAMSAAKEAVAGGQVQQTVRHAADTAVPMAKGLGYMVVDTIKQNPLPVALIGGGLIYLFVNSMKNDMPPSQRYDAMTPGVRDYDATYEMPRTGYSEPSAMDRAKEKMGDAADAVKDKVGDIASGVKSKVSDTAAVVKDKASDVKEMVSDKADAVKGKVTDMASTVRTSVTDVTHKVTDQAQQGAVWVKDNSSRVMDESPLLVGAAVVALGALVGLLVPATEAENRMMGEARDRLVDTASQKASQLTDKVSTVATKTLDSLKDSASDAISSAKATANDAIDRAKTVAQNEANNQNFASALEV